MPLLRTVWTSGCGRYGLVAADWDDGAPSSYGMIVHNGGAWAWCTGDDEHQQARRALSSWLDQRTQQAE